MNVKLNERDRTAIERLAVTDSLTPLQRRDRIYRILVERAGMFGKAFFGHKTTKAERRSLNELALWATRLVAKGEAGPEPEEDPDAGEDLTKSEAEFMESLKP